VPNQLLFTPTQAVKALTSHAGEPLWILMKGYQRLSAELLRRRKHSWEVHLSHDGVFRYSERHPTRARALEEAVACRRELEQKGWNSAWQGEDVSIDPFEMFEWLRVHYREVAAAPDFQMLSGFERWVRLREHVRQAHSRNGQGKLDALDRLGTTLKPQLLQWLDRRPPR
jgi:hypothetical protein